jgi:ribosomal protein S19
MILNKSIFNIDKTIKIFVRNSNISNFFVNRDVYIHNGMLFKRLLVLKRFLGMKFGEFSFTKRMGSYIHMDK